MGDKVWGHHPAAWGWHNILDHHRLGRAAQGPAGDLQHRLQHPPKLQILGSSPIAAKQARPPLTLNASAGGSELPGCPLPALCQLSIPRAPCCWSHGSRQSIPGCSPSPELPPPDRPIH